MNSFPHFPPSLFFDLTRSSYQDLFVEEEEVWESLKKLQNYLYTLPLGKIRGEIHHSATLVRPNLISIEEGSLVGPGVCIEGPVFIGKNCTIRHGALVRPHVLLEEGVIIGHASEVKGSILLSYSALPHFNYVGDSIVGNRVNIGAGAVCANTRLDLQPIEVVTEGKRVATGLRKLGAVIGDDSMLGCHVVTNPGTLLPKKSWIKPCRAISSFH